MTSVYTAADAGTGLRSDRAHSELKRRLLVGEFPLNQRLGEERLAALLGVSRTPIREAMHRLHAEGLVRRADDGGYEPVAPDVSGVRQLYEVRTGLELFALHRPARVGSQHDRAMLLDLREEWTALRDDDEPEATPDFVLLDESFHVTLAEAGGNAALAEMLQQVNERIRVVRMQDFLAVDRVTLTIQEHIGIIDAVLEGDMLAAEQRFLAHIDVSIAVVEDRVNRAVVRMVGGGRT